MDTAGSDDDEESVLWVFSCDDCDRFITTCKDCLFGFAGLWDLMLEEFWRGQRIVASYAPIFGVFLVADRLVLDEE